VAATPCALFLRVPRTLLLAWVGGAGVFTTPVGGVGNMLILPFFSCQSAFPRLNETTSGFGTGTTKPVSVVFRSKTPFHLQGFAQRGALVYSFISRLGRTDDGFLRFS